MTVAALHPRGEVAANIRFFKAPADNAKPFNYVDTPPAGKPQRNFDYVDSPVTIQDIRGRESDFSLDRDAFQIVTDVPPSAEPDFLDDDSIKKNYYPEVEKLLLDTIPGSNRIHLFDHTIRRAQPDAHRAPVLGAHVDQTAWSVEKRVRRYFPDEADKLLQGRYRIVNVWRPLNKNPVESFPLAVASNSSVEDEDVVPIQHIYVADGYNGETAGIKPNPGQKWYYLSGMTGSERLLLECFDSESLKPGSKIGGRVPHTAFEDPRTRPDAEPRESIEVRALVFGP
ncbi:hypothetical protein B0I35DRAFT_428479 [Stachybotrys elegans]|uniref:Methyltransferase n=1 Tax=Stachybotrys elegans TaxID=80388 RepID=A0A8K0WSQ1_9HYPO|nr:hypothetical protein B0I35DRAFT_428479 [Stachybotrys elegans]